MKSKSKIYLADGNEYCVFSSLHLEDGKFLLLSTMENPLDFKVVEVIEDNDKTYVQPFQSAGYSKILNQLIKNISKS